MTEEAQPPGVQRAADETPGQPAGDQPRYHEPSYALPTDAPLPVPSASGQPGPAASEWARPEPGTPAPAATNPGAAWSGTTSGPAAPTSGPTSVGVRGAATGAAYPMPEAFRTDAQAAPAGYPGTSGPAGGAGLAGGGRFGAVPAPPQESLRAPSRVDAVPGTPFGLVHLEVAPVTSGPAVASLVTGVGSVLVAFAGGCLGLAGSSPADWGGWVAGAFAVLAGLLGVTGVLLGELGRRQTSPGGRALWPGRRHPAPAAAPGATAPPVRFTGRGLAIAGISCAAVGLALTVIALAVAVLLQLV
ncbi:phage holin family protein [Plantactinospora veratri]|uniref:Phage holin family protein n=1 Tax=Plantactinospora veratri TaxID=1436122 RepID=A0ABU7S747_9ACTN